MEQERTPQNLDAYVSRLFAPEGEHHQATRAKMKSEALPEIQISASEGKLLHLLVLITGAKRILEVGTLGGYSALWLASALPADGRMVSLELDPHHAEVSRHNLAKAGLGDRVQVRIGPASDSLAKLQEEGVEQFDIVFIDADKDGYPGYLDQVLPLTREGGLILADNTLLGSVLDPEADTGIVRYNAAVAAHPNLTSVIVPFLKNGIDGLLISLKRTAAE